MIKRYTLVNPSQKKINLGSIQISENYNALRITIVPKQTEKEKRKEMILFFERELKIFFEKKGVTVFRNG